MKTVVIIGFLLIPSVTVGQKLNKLKIVPLSIEEDSTAIAQIASSLKPEHSDKENSLPKYIDDTELFVNFSGGDTALSDYIQKNISMPDSAVFKGIHGNVVVSFHINASGEISVIKVLKGLKPNIDKKVMEMIAGMPNWIWDKKLSREKRSINKLLNISFDL